MLRPRADLARVLLAISPFLGAALIAISRLEDYRHDVFDVVVGSCLGLLIAYATWRRYYPHLASSNCAEPYDSLDESISAGAGAFARVRDEEAMIGDDREFELSDDERRYPVVPPRDRQ